MVGFREMKRAILILVIGLFWCSVSFAECIEGDCNNGYEIYTSADGDKYIGEWKVNKREGQGTFTFADGRKYVGKWKDGKTVKSKVEISKGKDLKGSPLPRCKGADHLKWTNCFGKQKITDTFYPGVY